MELELVIGGILFLLLIVFAFVAISGYKKAELKDPNGPRNIWNSKHVFESIPSLFPTLGIGLTAAGIIIGLWSFNTQDTQKSITELLGGLKFSFFATILGIVGLIVFQKVSELTQTKIDNSPSKPRKASDELTALTGIADQLTRLNDYFENVSVAQFKEQNSATKDLLKAINDLKLDSAKNNSEQTKVLERIETLTQNQEFEENKRFKENKQREEANFQSFSKQFLKVFDILKQQEKIIGDNIAQIINSMQDSNELLKLKFDEFSDLLKKSNTDALVEVMRKSTEQFNAQMNDLINKLVKENFAELNSSVQNMVEWQKENKSQIQVLVQQFNNIKANLGEVDLTLKSVGSSLVDITNDSSNLRIATKELKAVFVESGTLNKAAKNLETASVSNAKATEAYANSTTTLQEWIKKEIEFRAAAEKLTTAIKEVSNFNSSAWDGYRSEMKNATNIIRDSNDQLARSATNYNAEFFERLSATLANLDSCIQRMVIAAKR